MFFPQALHCLVQVFVLDLLLLPLRAVICPDPGVERVCIHAQVTSGLGNGLLRLARQFHRLGEAGLTLYGLLIGFDRFLKPVGGQTAGSQMTPNPRIGWIRSQHPPTHLLRLGVVTRLTQLKRLRQRPLGHHDRGGAYGNPRGGSNQPHPSPSH